MQSNTSKQQLLRDILNLAKKRMLLTKTANETNGTVITTTTFDVSSLNENLSEIVLGVGYMCIILVLIIKIVVGTIRKFEYYYMSPSYNRFGFIANEYSDYDDESESESESESEYHRDKKKSSSSPQPPSPVSSRPILSSGKYLHLQTPIQTINTITPKTPVPVRRSLRLKIKSELNLSIMKDNKVITRSQTKENRTIMPTSISSDPCPKIRHSSITTPSPHPEHDEEREYYIRYCNEKKMRKNRPEFNSPLIVRRLVL